MLKTCLVELIAQFLLFNNFQSFVKFLDLLLPPFFSWVCWTLLVADFRRIFTKISICSSSTEKAALVICIGLVFQLLDGQIVCVTPLVPPPRHLETMLVNPVQRTDGFRDKLCEVGR